MPQQDLMAGRCWSPYYDRIPSYACSEDQRRRNPASSSEEEERSEEA